MELRKGARVLHGVWHFSFTVSDLDRSIEFYRDLLGFELVHTQEQANAYTRRLVGYPDASLRVAQFAVPGQPRGISTHDLELVQYLSPNGERGSREICNPGAAHMAMTVDDIHQRYERFVSAGVEFVSTDFDLFRAALVGTRFASAPVTTAPRALAAAIGRIAHARLQAGEAQDPAALDANYVRRSDAELALKRQPTSY